MVEGSDAYGLVDASKMSLVPNLVLPPKFKVPTFDKYDGTKCPSANLYMYCRKMIGHTNNDKHDKLLIHCFQDSLTRLIMDGFSQGFPGSVQVHDRVCTR